MPNSDTPSSSLAYLDKYVSKINTFHQRTVEQIVKLGNVLREAKAKANHGDWTPFLESVGIPERSAQRWMKASEIAADDPDRLKDAGTLRALLYGTRRQSAASESQAPESNPSDPTPCRVSDAADTLSVRCPGCEKAFTVRRDGTPIIEPGALATDGAEAAQQSVN